MSPRKTNKGHHTRKSPNSEFLGGNGFTNEGDDRCSQTWTTFSYGGKICHQKKREEKRKKKVTALKEAS